MDKATEWAIKTIVLCQSMSKLLSVTDLIVPHLTDQQKEKLYHAAFALRDKIEISQKKLINEKEETKND